MRSAASARNADSSLFPTNNPKKLGERYFSRRKGACNPWREVLDLHLSKHGLDLCTCLKLMRMFSSDAADGVHNVIHLCVTAGERMGQSDVRKRVVSAIPADLIFVKMFQMLR